MNKLALILLIGCSASKPAPAPRNLAAEIVLAVEPDAKCDPLYNGEGPTLTYSARCKLPSKAVIYATVSTDKGPGIQQLNSAPAPQPEAPVVPPPSPPEAPTARKGAR